jgi:hypothetical protein
MHGGDEGEGRSYPNQLIASHTLGGWVPLVGLDGYLPHGAPERGELEKDLASLAWASAAGAQAARNFPTIAARLAPEAVAAAKAWAAAGEAEGPAGRAERPARPSSGAAAAASAPPPPGPGWVLERELACLEIASSGGKRALEEIQQGEDRLAELTAQQAQIQQRVQEREARVYEAHQRCAGMLRQPLGSIDRLVD